MEISSGDSTNFLSQQCALGRGIQRSRDRTFRLVKTSPWAKSGSFAFRPLGSQTLYIALVRLQARSVCPHVFRYHGRQEKAPPDCSNGAFLLLVSYWRLFTQLSTSFFTWSFAVP